MRKPSTLQIALAFSLGVHAALLSLRIAAPEAFNRIFQDTPLEVILVNTRTKEAPNKAAALAQANLAGGGQEETGRATSPLPPSRVATEGEADEDVFVKRAQLEREQEMLLAQQRRELALQTPPDRQRSKEDANERARVERNRQQLQQFAEIEKRINQESARPKKRFVSPSTQEVMYALYYDGMRQKIEEKGTRDFPQERGRKLYGELVMNIHVDLRGNVIDTEILQSSGKASLDKRAVAIVRSASPFGNFTAEMRKGAEILIMTTRFKFTGSNSLETTLMGQPQ